MKGFVENNQDSRADCKRTALNMLRHAGINLPPMAIELAVRVGSKPGNNRTVRNRNKVVNRPMSVRFLHIEDRDNVLLRKELIYRRCSIEVEEDYPPDMEERRKELRLVMRAINNSRVEGRIKYRASVFEDKLIVNGKLYSVETLDKLPSEISTVNLSTPRKNNMVAFLSKQSPLSNYY